MKAEQDGDAAMRVDWVGVQPGIALNHECVIDECTRVCQITHVSMYLRLNSFGDLMCVGFEYGPTCRIVYRIRNREAQPSDREGRVILFHLRTAPERN